MADLHYTKAPTTSDEFNNSSLASKWTESYQAGGSSAEGTAYLVVTSGDSYISISNWNASGVYQSFTGDFDVRLKLQTDTFSGTVGNRQLGFGFWIDATHYIFVFNTNDGLYKNGGSTSSSTGSAVPPAPYYYRVLRSGTTVTVYASSNGTSWTTVKSSAIGSGAGRIWISVSDAGSTGFTASFDWFRNEPNVVTHDITLYSSEGGTWHDSLRVRVGGATWYAQLDSNLSHTYASDLRIRQSGTTYAVLTEEGTPS